MDATDAKQIFHEAVNDPVMHDYNVERGIFAAAVSFACSDATKAQLAGNGLTVSDSLHGRFNIALHRSVYDNVRNDVNNLAGDVVIHALPKFP